MLATKARLESVQQVFTCQETVEIVKGYLFNDFTETIKDRDRSVVVNIFIVTSFKDRNTFFSNSIRIRECLPQTGKKAAKQ